LRSSLCRLSAFKKACPFEFKEGAFRLSGGGGHAISQMSYNETMHAVSLVPDSEPKL